MSIVEKMARAICCGVNGCSLSHSGSPFATCQASSYMNDARNALTATGLTEQQLEVLANGTMVVVPVELNDAMVQAMLVEVQTGNPYDTPTEDDVRRGHAAMLAAKEG